MSSIRYLSCGKQYVGQTGRCINDRLREHACNVKNGRDGFLDLHCSKCGCKPLFQKSFTMGKNKNRLTHEIIEAEKICRLGPGCVNTRSLRLSEKELRFPKTTKCSRIASAWSLAGVFCVYFAIRGYTSACSLE